MNKILNTLFIPLGIATLCTACSGNKSTASVADSIEAEAILAEEETDEAAIRKVVEKWNTSLNNRDYKKSVEVYAGEVEFYTKTLSGDRASEMRIELASKDPSWRQTIVTDIDIDDLGNGLFQAVFTKQSDSAKGIRTYPAYLQLRKIGDDWKIVKESDKVTDNNVASRKSNIPADAIRGDFNGDGRIEYLWSSGKFDSDGYALGKLKLDSDDSELKGLSWNASRGVFLMNVGDLNGSGRDFIGVIPENDSSWTIYEVYGWKDGKWIPLIEPFGIWTGDDDVTRVWKSSRKGYVETKQHIMGDIDTQFDPVYQTVKMKW